MSVKRLSIVDLKNMKWSRKAEILHFLLFLYMFYLIKEKYGGKKMLSKEKINRINELSKKSKSAGLSVEEAKEQTQLRKEYLSSFRSSMRDTIENVKVIDPDGTDVTPEKVKQAQNRKNLH